MGGCDVMPLICCGLGLGLVYLRAVAMLSGRGGLNAKIGCSLCHACVGHGGVRECSMCVYVCCLRGQCVCLGERFQDHVNSICHMHNSVT